MFILSGPVNFGNLRQLRHIPHYALDGRSYFVRAKPGACTI